MPRKRARTAKGRNSTTNIEWRLSVIKRDNHQCRQCGALNGLVAHHIVPWNDSVELRFDINNGLTLCHRCHNRHHRNGKGIKQKGVDCKLGTKTGWSYWTGKKFSDDHRKNMSLSRIGKPVSQEHRRKLSEKNRLPEIMEANKLRYKGRTWKIDPETGKRVWIDK